MADSRWASWLMYMNIFSLVATKLAAQVASFFVVASTQTMERLWLPVLSWHAALGRSNSLAPSLWQLQPSSLCSGCLYLFTWHLEQLPMIHLFSDGQGDQVYSNNSRASSHVAASTAALSRDSQISYSGTWTPGLLLCQVTARSAWFVTWQPAQLLCHVTASSAALSNGSSAAL